MTGVFGDELFRRAYERLCWECKRTVRAKARYCPFCGAVLEGDST